MSAGGDTNVNESTDLGFGYSDHSNSDEEVAITACHIGRLTVNKEGVTTDRSGSVGESPKAFSNIPGTVLSGDIFFLRRSDWRVSVWEEDICVTSAITAEHRFKSHRIGSEECASYGSKDLAGEARRWDSVEQYGSVVSLARS